METHFGIWALVAGFVLVTMALAGSVLKRLPLSTAMVYLAVGVVMGPWAFGITDLHWRDHAWLLERTAEVVVLLSLFTCGLKLSPAPRESHWRAPLRLALVSMAAVVALVTAAGVWLLGLPLGAAVLLGAIVAPTDPVLASDVQVHEPEDRDQLRIALTGEGGLNDGTAFPFAMLGLGLLGLHELGDFGWRWFTVDVLWACACGLAVGYGLGLAVARLVVFLRRTHREAVGLDDLLALGLIAFAYGAALLLKGYGFLAVFAAGVAFRQFERRSSAAADGASPPAPAAPEESDANDIDPVTDPQQAPAELARSVLAFNEQAERIGEVTAVILLGLLLASVPWGALPGWHTAGFVVLMLVVIRPLSVWLGLLNSRTTPRQRRLIGWFGIRGIGSLFYLAYAVNHGLPAELADRIAAPVFALVVVSVVLHGVSVTPLMKRYERKGAG